MISLSMNLYRFPLGFKINNELDQLGVYVSYLLGQKSVPQIAWVTVSRCRFKICAELICSERIATIAALIRDRSVIWFLLKPLFRYKFIYAQHRFNHIFCNDKNKYIQILSYRLPLTLLFKFNIWQRRRKNTRKNYHSISMGKRHISRLLFFFCQMFKQSLISEMQ